MIMKMPTSNMIANTLTISRTMKALIVRAKTITVRTVMVKFMITMMATIKIPKTALNQMKIMKAMAKMAQTTIMTTATFTFRKLMSTPTKKRIRLDPMARSPRIIEFIPMTPEIIHHITAPTPSTTDFITKQQLAMRQIIMVMTVMNIMVAIMVPVMVVMMATIVTRIMMVMKMLMTAMMVSVLMVKTTMMFMVVRIIMMIAVVVLMVMIVKTIIIMIVTIR